MASCVAVPSRRAFACEFWKKVAWPLRVMMPGELLWSLDGHSSEWAGIEEVLACCMVRGLSRAYGLFVDLPRFLDSYIPSSPARLSPSLELGALQRSYGRLEQDILNCNWTGGAVRAHWIEDLEKALRGMEARYTSGIGRLYAVWKAKPYFLAEGVRNAQGARTYDVAFWNDAGSMRASHGYGEWPDVRRVQAIFEQAEKLAVERTGEPLDGGPKTVTLSVFLPLLL
ncbi:uncharacterized protein EV420DRAFT_1485032 [Desarmillaria tabescens]|uniref:Uncharacterized protein n=1 Tax=Armillaria tabescens TaxID=1929756 RepID=A0AA39JK38_ARMTA|nr:uncharacterized protein EV420DRAFT_1485032 [Desarmillaria tabescens]KAK0443385.1 hypothetical protein EV420DRAFT_1485032 [Desarmillaria tabescens]